jgi:hypothetical protein
VKYKEGTDFNFFEFDKSELTGIELYIKGYEGVIYHYHKAKVVEEGEIARLQFGFTIVHPGKHDIDLLQNDEEFVTIMGDILQEILLSKAKADEQIRTNNPEEFNLQ